VLKFAAQIAQQWNLATPLEMSEIPAAQEAKKRQT